MSDPVSYPADVLARAAKIELLLCDVDGTLTDGALLYLPDGGIGLRFHVHDGLAMVRWRRAGRLAGVMSLRDVPAIRRRAEDLHLDEVHLAIEDKGAAIREVLSRRGLPPAACCFVGDDVIDIPAFAECGLAVAVADALPRVREAAAWVTPRPGGCGAVRDVIEMLFAARGERL